MVHCPATSQTVSLHADPSDPRQKICCKSEIQVLVQNLSSIRYPLFWSKLFCQPLCSLSSPTSKLTSFVQFSSMCMCVALAVIVLILCLIMHCGGRQFLFCILLCSLHVFNLCQFVKHIEPGVTGVSCFRRAIIIIIILSGSILSCILTPFVLSYISVWFLIISLHCTHIHLQVYTHT